MTNKNKSTKVFFACVCYNAYEDSLRLLKSIEAAFNIVDDVILTVVLCDNSTISDDVGLVQNVNFSYEYTYMKNENVGYFPAFNLALNSIGSAKESFDYVVVSNVDLVLDVAFFKALTSFCRGGVGVIAPSIISTKNFRDLNPKILIRPKRIKLEFLRLIFSFPYLFGLYHSLSLRKSSKTPTFFSVNDGLNDHFYAPHGSFIIFTSLFFEKGALVNYPRFLFGEEVFVAEQCRLNDVKICHVPSIKVYDEEHGSTSKINKVFLAAEHVGSYKYLIKNFFKVKK